MSGSVIAMYFVGCGRVADCAGSTCSSQPFPIPNGHWGSPFRVCKDPACSAKGGPINTGDFVFFRRLSGGFTRWGNYYVDTSGSSSSVGATLGGRSGTTKECSDSTSQGCFLLEKA